MKRIFVFAAGLAASLALHAAVPAVAPTATGDADWVALEAAWREQPAAGLSSDASIEWAITHSQRVVELAAKYARGHAADAQRFTAIEQLAQAMATVPLPNAPGSASMRSSATRLLTRRSPKSRGR